VARTHLLVANGTACRLHGVEFTQEPGAPPVGLTRQADDHMGHPILRASPRVPILLLKVEGPPSFPPIGDLPPGVFPLAPSMTYPTAATLARHPFLNNVSGFRQFPVVLGFAMTVHKVQGMSMDQIIVAEHHSSDPSMATVNKPNMLYTSVSRSRTLAGLYFLREITQADIDYANIGVREFAGELARLEACEQAAAEYYPAPAPLPVTLPPLPVPREPPAPSTTSADGPAGGDSHRSTNGREDGTGRGRRPCEDDDTNDNARRPKRRRTSRPAAGSVIPPTASTARQTLSDAVRDEHGLAPQPPRPSTASGATDTVMNCERRRARDNTNSDAPRPKRARRTAPPTTTPRQPPTTGCDPFTGSLYWVPLLHDIVECPPTCAGMRNLHLARERIDSCEPALWARAVQAYRLDFQQRGIGQEQVHACAGQRDGYIGAAHQEAFLYPSEQVVAGVVTARFAGQSRIEPALFDLLQQTIALLRGREAVRNRELERNREI
jgi:hypothetical protein